MTQFITSYQRMSCDRGYGITGYPTCSGHASACIDDKCMCDPGWNSIGDFELREGYDCDMHHTGLLIGRIITLLTAAVSFLLVSLYVFREKIWIFKNLCSLKNVCFAATIGVNIFSIVIMSLKIHNPRNRYFGLDYYTSITCIFLGFSINSVEMSFTLIFIRFLKGYSRFLDGKRREHFNKSSEWMNKVLPIVPFVFALQIALVNIISIRTNKDSEDNNSIAFIWIIIAHYAFVGVCLEYIVYIFLMDVGSFLKQSDISHCSTESKNSNDRASSGNRESTNNPRRLPELEILYKKLRRVNRILAPFYVNGILVNIVFAVWPFLRRKLEYLNTFEIMTLQIVSAGISWTVTKISVKENLTNAPDYQKVAPMNAITVECRGQELEGRNLTGDINLI